MILKSKRELDITRKKLRELENLHATTLSTSVKDAYAHQLTLRSLQRSINQLKEEIARFEARIGSAGSKE